MIITESLIVHNEHIEYWKEIENHDRFHSFKIISIKDMNSETMKDITFTYDGRYTKYLFIDLFHVGKKCGMQDIYNTLKPNHEATY